MNLTLWFLEETMLLIMNEVMVLICEALPLTKHTVYLLLKYTTE